ncbi:hypothetical protein BGW42_001898 [Actinomortierella wolfii]|nr:hypothetical protein BGW42_001898 [Actinomortierella wolfii]
MSVKELSITIDNKDDGIRIWKIALSHWKTIVQSREQLRRCFKRGEITLNGTIAHETQNASKGDRLVLRFDKRAAHESVYGREKLAVLVEDDELAIVLKPSGKTMMEFGLMLRYSLKPSPVADKEQQEIIDKSLPVDHGQESLATSASEEKVSNGGKQTEDLVMNDDDGEENSQVFEEQRVPCAIHGMEKASNGLVLVAKTWAMRQKLMHLQSSGGIRRSFRIICHGAFEKPSQDNSGSTDAISLYYQPQESIPINRQVHDASGIHQLRVFTLTPSNTSNFVTTLDAEVESPTMGIHLRRYLMSVQHPVIGNSNSTRPLKANRDKGLCLALLKVEFQHPSTGSMVRATIEEPKKFEALRDREEKAYNNRKQQDLEELQKGGLELAEEYDRKTEKPIAYLVGEKDFFNLRFSVTPAVLIPRSSTETLVKATLDLVKEQKELSPRREGVRILDVGTGSGCLLLALLKNFDGSTGMGIDISPEALEVANVNRERHNMTDRATFAVGDLGKLQDTPGIYKQFDFLVCNPPYLDSGKTDRLQKSFTGTRYEPSVALFAEKGGYRAYEMLAESLRCDVALLQASSHDANPKATIMAPHGHVVLEIGSGMGPHVREIFNFLRFVKALKDLQDTERCLVFAMP